MNKQTLRGGKIIGSIKNRELPVELHGLIGEGVAIVHDDQRYPTGKKVPGLKLARRNQRFAISAIPSAALLGGTASYFLPKMLEATRNPTAANVLAYALPVVTAVAAGVEVSESKQKVQDVRKIHSVISQSITEHYKHNPQIRELVDKGATHFAVDGKGNLHFIVADKKLAGKAFRPIFGRMREAVVKPGPSGKKIYKPPTMSPKKREPKFRYMA